MTKKPWETSIKPPNTRKEGIVYNSHGKKITQSTQTITILTMADCYHVRITYTTDIWSNSARSFKKGMTEKVESKKFNSALLHYISHDAAIKPNNNTTKVRIVHDTSTKTKGGNTSLNKCMYQGPVILKDLCTLLLRFQTNKIVDPADIEIAYLQVSLQEPRGNVTQSSLLKEYQILASVSSGITCSSFLLSGSI